MRKFVWKYGLLGGAVLSGLMLLTIPFHDRIGFGTAGLVVGYAGMVLGFLMVFAGVKAYRDQVAGGSVRFGRAFVVGLLIALVACLGYVATWQVLYYGFMPDFMDKYAAHSLAEMKQAGASEAELAAKSKEMADFAEMYRNPLVNAAFTLMEPLPVGLLYSLLAAAVMSRKRRDPAGGTGPALGSAEAR